VPAGLNSWELLFDIPAFKASTLRSRRTQRAPYY